MAKVVSTERLANVTVHPKTRANGPDMRGNQFALAAAVSVIIFFIIATISAINFRLTGALEDLSKNV